MTAEPQPPRPPFNAPSCLYVSGGTPQMQITVRVLTGDQIATVPGQSTQTYFNSIKNGLTNVAPLTGYGDEAFSAGSAGSNVYARKGTTLVQITAGVGGVSQTAVAATRKVLADVLAKV